MNVSTDFETIYAESFLSATGEDLYHPDHQADHAAFVNKAADDTLESWTQRDVPPSVQELSTLSHLSTLHITHPDQENFDEADVHMIARVRFLGRTIIDTAKRQLLSNEQFLDVETKDTIGIFDYFQAFDWHAEHPTDDTENQSQTQDVASPLRLGTWPKGDYINCLGVSIGMAAASEIYGIPYVYGNEIRNSQSLMSSQHTMIMKRFRELIPQFDNGLIQDVMAQTMKGRRRPDPLYDNILFTNPAILQHNPNPRDFHHFILCDYRNEADPGMWAQVDPFDLSFAGLSVSRRQIDRALDPLLTTGNENSVIISDETVMITQFYGQFGRSIEDAYSRSTKLSESIETSGSYKSEQFFKDLEAKTASITRQVMAQLYGTESGSQSPGNDELGNGITRQMYLCMLYAYVARVPEANTLFTHHMQAKHKVDWEVLDSKIEAILTKNFKYDQILRESFINNITNIPLLALLHLYEYNLKAIVHVRDIGDSNPVMEIADPEFMIGAMYMNHYATWRKDGRINVARHLSRICSSQLLWQAARQDEKEVDERIASMGEVIQRLKPRQLHPLVNIASGIPNYQ
jgi:hypothetical protein